MTPPAITTCLLTGASGGLGIAIAEALASRGMHLLLSGRNEAALSTLKTRVEALGGQATVLIADLSRPEAIEPLAQAIEEAVPRLDCMIHNAGILHAGHYEALDAEALSARMQLNLLAPMQLTRRLLAPMIEADHGCVILMSSLAGLGPAAFSEDYGAAKHGLVGFGRSLRASLKQRESKVRVTTLCPGYIADVGMFDAWVQDHGVSAPKSAGTSTAKEVVKALIRGLEGADTELIVSPRPVRPFLALDMLFPRVAAWLARRLDVSAPAKRIARKKASETSEQSET